VILPGGLVETGHNPEWFSLVSHMKTRSRSRTLSGVISLSLVTTVCLGSPNNMTLVNPGLGAVAKRLPASRHFPGMEAIHAAIAGGALAGVGVLAVCPETVVVTSTNSAGPGSLSDAVERVCTGGTITFAPALNGATLVVSNGPLNLSRGQRILGPGPSRLTLSGVNLRALFAVEGSSNVLTGLTLTEGTPGIENSGELSISNCVLSENRAAPFSTLGLGLASGGAIANSGRLAVDASVFRDNIAFVDNVIDGFTNRQGYGGAILNTGNLTIRNSTFTGNSAGTGGAILNFDSGVLTIVNSTFSENFTRDELGFFGSHGGAVYNSGVATITHSTVVLNRSAWQFGSGGIYNFNQLASPSRAFLLDTIVAGNLDGVGAPSDIGGYSRVTEASHVLVGNAATSFGVVHGVNGNIVGNNGAGTMPITQIINTNLADNGGPTPTHALVAGSAALNAGRSPFEPQQINVVGASGTFTLRFNGEMTGALPYNATSDQIQNALNALPSIGGVGGLVTVTRAVPNEFKVTFGGTLAGVVQQSIAGFGSVGVSITVSLPYSLPVADQRGGDFLRIAADRLDIGAYENQAPEARCDGVTLLAGTSCSANASPFALEVASSDPDGDPLTFRLQPPGPYPLGNNAVTFWAIDNKGASNRCDTFINVVDGSPPFIQCPGELVFATAPGDASVVGFYDVTAVDSCDTNVTVSCVPPSGSSFPLGETTVTCSARDSRGNIETCGFTVVVAPPVFSVGNLGLPPVSFGAVAWGDYDNDGRLDLVVTGNSTNGPITQIWRNLGNNTLSNINAGFPGLTVSAAAWGDYNNDGRLDLAIAGSTTGNQRLTQIWRNTGAGFVNINAGLTGVDDGALAWGDFDNDGRPDLLVTGVNGPRIAEVWRNQGEDHFVNANAGLPGIATGGAAWGDYNNDGRLDLVMSGFDSGGGRQTMLWRNTGSGFVRVQTDLPGVTASALAWADYDNDGWLDLAIAGNTGESAITEVWRNAGGSFSKLNLALPGVAECSIAWGDYDNDGRPDLLLTGTQRNGGPLAQIWRNQGSNFVNTPSGLAGVRIGRGAWGDFDNDGRLDVVLIGNSATGQVTQVWHNNSASETNSPPSPPTGLSVQVDPGSVTFRWNAASDGQMPAPGLSYNLAVGTEADPIGVLSPMARLGTGWRRIPALGGAQLNLFATLRLPAGTYTWAVQAVDSAWAGGSFAAGNSFVVGPGPVTLTDAERRPNGEFSFRWLGVTGAAYRVEWSEGFANWNDLGPASEIGTGQFEFVDRTPTAERRFYQVVFR
jgi:HYR domain/FG-GAP-like repeat